MQKNPNKGYLTFTKKERGGIIVTLCVVLLVFVCAKYIYPFISKEETGNSNDLTEAAALLKEKQKDSTKNYYPKNDYGNDDFKSYTKKSDENSFTGEMFYFDPNTLDESGWKKLGVRDKTIATIRNYVIKGGKFREPDDLRKIWGLRGNDKDRLIPYVRIAAQIHKPYSSGNSENNFQPYEKKVYEKRVAQPVEINSGDSAAFDALPGIGPGYSRRIINFRNRLGGFYKVDQVGETFGLPDSVFQKIKPLLKISGDNVRKINLNTATNEELKAHPYIRWQLANVIMEYKKQHGDFKALDDLRKIMVINQEMYSRISPYLSL